MAKKRLKFKREIPYFMREWLELQTDKGEALKYLIRKDIEKNGIRDVHFDQSVYNNQEIDSVVNSSEMLNFHNQVYNSYRGNFQNQGYPQQPYYNTQGFPHGQVSQVTYNNGYNQQYQPYGNVQMMNQQPYGSQQGMNQQPYGNMQMTNQQPYSNQQTVNQQPYSNEQVGNQQVMSQQSYVNEQIQSQQPSANQQVVNQQSQVNQQVTNQQQMNPPVGSTTTKIIDPQPQAQATNDDSGTFGGEKESDLVDFFNNF